MDERLEVASFLPDITLPSTQADTMVPLRPLVGRTTVLVAMHSPGCGGCRRYVDEIAGSGGEFNLWEARLLISVPGGSSGGEPWEPRFGTVVADAESRLSSPAQASVIIADRYGHIFEISRADEGHHFPTPRQLEEWLKYLGTLCPE